MKETIKASLADSFLHYTTVFEILKRLKVPLVKVGNTADALGIREIDCQLGCF
ncbi:MAG: hypothetical protein WC369_04275 [Dehalococcoidales bacterium]|jgi:hypothetical protein